MSEMDLKLDGIAGGILVEKTDKKKVDADQKKRMYASAFAYIRSQTGMNKKEFAKYLGIPYRTLQDWELGNTQAPEYVLRLIAYKVQMEKEKGEPIMTVIRFILRIVLLPVQAMLTLLILAIDFLSGWAILAFRILGALFLFGGLCEFISKTGSTSLGWQGIIVAVIIVAVPQAVVIWGEAGILRFKELLARI